MVSEHEWGTLSLESVLGPSGYAVLRTFNGRQAIERIASVAPDVVFVDERLPDMEGVQLCRILRQQSNISASTPIIIVGSEQVSRQQSMGALRAGAWDYLRQPVDAEQLLLRLESYLRAKFEADRARDESLLDQSTGFYSMRGLLRRARELASEAQRYRRSLACVVISPDIGSSGAVELEQTDGLIDRMASMFRATNRTSDAIGRLGPHEFVLLAPETDAAGAQRLAERLRAAVAALNQERGGPAIRLRIGCFAVDDFASSEIEPVEMLTRATLALRLSQADDGEAIHFYGPRPQNLN